MVMALPKVSVVITVKHDPEGLAALLQALAQQTHPPEEVVITVAEPEENAPARPSATYQVAKHWRPPATTTVQVLPIPENTTRAAGRNIGVAAAQHSIIAFTDAGCVPEPEWLEALLTPFAPPTSTVLVSGFTWVKATSAWQAAQAPFVLVPFSRIPKHPLPATRNMAITKAVFLENHGFQTDLKYAEDYEFARRLAQHGIQAKFVPEARVNWQPRPDWASYVHMIYRLTLGDCQAHTWRRGHLTMWLRYGLLVVLIAGVRWLQDEKTALLIGGGVYVIYLIIKSSRFIHARPSSYLWTPLLQLGTDMAVLAGTLRGSLHVMFSSLHSPRQPKRHV